MIRSKRRRGDSEGSAASDRTAADGEVAAEFPAAAVPAVAAPATDAPAAGRPDDAVLDELSHAFGNRPTIAIGGDVEFPDAVYLDEELERGVATGATLFIDDDGSADAVAPKEASTRGIEPKLRQRRIGVRRAENRRRIKWLFIGGVVLVVLTAVLAVFGSSLFGVDAVKVTGNVYTDPEALQSIVDDLIGRPVLRVDTGDFESRIEALAWVDDARVRTQFPDAASIEIRERTPLVAMPGADGMTRVLDRDGRVLDVIEGQPVALVWISGPGTLDSEVGQIAPIGYSSAATLVQKLTPTIRSRVESMTVTPDGSDLRLILTGVEGNAPLEVRFGSAIGDNEQIDKLVRLERKLEDVGDRAGLGHRRVDR